MVQSEKQWWSGIMSGWQKPGSVRRCFCFILNWKTKILLWTNVHAAGFILFSRPTKRMAEQNSVLDGSTGYHAEIRLAAADVRQKRFMGNTTEEQSDGNNPLTRPLQWRVSYEIFSFIFFWITLLSPAQFLLQILKYLSDCFWSFQYRIHQNKPDFNCLERLACFDVFVISHSDYFTLKWAGGSNLFYFRVVSPELSGRGVWLTPCLSFCAPFR